MSILYTILKFCNNELGKFSWSMNSEPVNAKYTGHQSTKEVLDDELEGYFRSD